MINKSPQERAWETRKKKNRYRKAWKTRKLKARGKKAAKTRRLRTGAKKAVETRNRRKLYNLTLGETKDSPEYEADRRLIGHFCFDAPYDDIKKLLKNFNRDKVYEAAEKFEHQTGHKAV